MSISNYTNVFNTKMTPQSQPIPGSDQVKNSAGGYSFHVDDFTRLERFLILGSEGGSYYASEKALTLENAKVVERCLKIDGKRTVETIVRVSDEGRAPKNDPAIFALAIAMKLGDEKTRALAQASFDKVIRIGTHLFQAAEAVKSLGGWGRGTKRAFTEWYVKKDLDDLALQVAKYQSREGWSHRDILRKLHVTPKNTKYANLFKWTVGKSEEKDLKKLPELIRGFEQIKLEKDPKKAAKLIEKYGLPRECVPTELLNSKEIWRTLLTSGKGMPVTAMVRNLAKMTAIGLLDESSDESRFIVKQLSDAELLKKARLHPLQVLMALRTYASGHGMKGSLSWTPVKRIVTALDDAFYGTFKTIQPTGKRLMLALDISGSMHCGNVGGTPLTPAEAAVAMALVALNTETDVAIYGFGTTFAELPFTKNDRLDKATQKISHMNFGGTDCSLPMTYALQKKHKYDAFFVYTDSETWAGNTHPVQALQKYRKEMNIPAKEVVVGLVSNGFTIADPNDAGMLDVVGFDTATPAVMAEFVRG